MLKDHINKLAYFKAVIDSGSFLAASQVIRITQPQLSRVVKQLEDDLETNLLVRTTQGVKMTSAGVKLYEAADEILKITHQTEKTIRSKETSPEGEIKIGTYDSIARYFFPGFLKFMKSAAPKLEISLETARSSEIYKRVKKNELEIGVIIDSDSYKARNVSKNTLYQDSFGLYSQRGGSEFVDKLISFPSSAYDEAVIDKICKNNNIVSSIKCDNLETVKSFAEEGLGVGLMPHLVARNSVMQGKLSELKIKKQKTPLFEHSIILIQRDDLDNESKKKTVENLSRFLNAWAVN